MCSSMKLCEEQAGIFCHIHSMAENIPTHPNIDKPCAFKKIIFIGNLKKVRF